MSQDKSSEQLEVSVVVPLFNEEPLVGELINRLTDACIACTKSYELILVNDGSYDRTLSLLIKQSAEHPEVTIINLARNFGHMQAITAGLESANGRAVVIMDGDLQDPPELIPGLMERWRDGAEVVLARRTLRGEGLYQRVLTAFFYRILNTIGEIPLPEQVGTFCLIDRRIVDIIIKMPERARFFAGLRAWTGFRTETVDYKRPARKDGKSKVGLIGQFSLARKGIVSFSNWPLIWLARLSLLASLGLFIFGLCVIGIKLFSDLAIPGWASTMVLVGMAASLNSAVLAVLSEYLAVIFEEIKKRPLFLVSEIYKDGEVIKES